ncbi:GAF domain-containing protein [Sporohalobacter salinus]|uniref:GAF domain-containing protein n=1 Tax=Sporohalobacter salinus TaxID=1494606 RepID=UPI0019614128|nr:GAF domain-containing protein [Sporohalobacter salinus]MBM7624817.1 chaperonin cofactor prefoldin [Sporohalobacter salinus]
MNFRRFKYSAIETLILNLIIFGIYFMFNPAREEFLTLNVHPLLIVTAVISLRYGNYLGLLSATIASFTFGTAYYLLGKDLYLLVMDFKYYKFLLMFYFAAVLLGRFRDNYEMKLRNRKREYQQLKTNYDQLQKNYEQIEMVNSELKKQIVEAEDSILSLYQIASSLERLDSEEVYTEVMGVLTKFLEAEVVSIYLLNDRGDFLRLKLRLGEESRLQNSIELEEFSALQLVVSEQKVIKKSGQHRRDTPLLSAPIINQEEVIGIINIEKMNFNRVTDYNYNLFKIIIDWINQALARAVLVEDRTNGTKYHKETGIMKYEDFKERLAEEKKRKERYGMEYSLLKFKNKALALVDIDRKFQQLVRGVDVISYDQQQDIIYVLLPATPRKFIPKIEDRILAVFNEEVERLE